MSTLEIQNLERRVRETRSKALEAVDRLERNPSTEAEAEADQLVAEVGALVAEVDARKALDAAERADAPMANDDNVAIHGGGLYGALKAARWNVHDRGPVVVPAEAVLGQKSDLIATQGNANPIPPSGGVWEKGRDSRFLYPHLPTQPISLETTQVQALVQTTRTLAAVGDMQLAIDSATTKPVTDSVATLTTFEPKWIATISNPQPIVLFNSPELRQMLNNDMANAYANSLDDLILDAIIAASGAQTASQASDPLPDFFRKARTTLENAGYSPNLLVVNPTTNEALDLAKDNDDHYMFPPDSGFWQMERVVSPQVAATKAYLLDRNTVQVYRSAVKFEADTSLYFESNRVVARLEGLAVPVVRQGAGILIGTIN